MLGDVPSQEVQKFRQYGVLILGGFGAGQYHLPTRLDRIVDLVPFPSRRARRTLSGTVVW